MYLDEQHSPMQRLVLAPDGRVRPILRCVLFLTLGAVLYFLAVGASATIGRAWSDQALSLLAYSLVDVLLLLESWFLLAVFDRRSFKTLGLWFYPGWGRDAALGCAVGTGLIGATVGALVVFGFVKYQGRAAAGPHLRGILVWAVILLLAAAFEELAMRGYGFQRLLESMGPLGGVAIFSLLFSAGHLGNPSVNWLALANTVLAGVLLSVAYLKTRALWMPLALHWSWNLLMGPVFSLPVSGQSVGAPLFVVEIRGAHWLSGGNYGPEGSIFLSIFCAAAIVLLARADWLKPSPAMGKMLNVDATEREKGVE